MTISKLKSIESVLKSQEFPCTFLPASSELPNDYLFAYLGNDFADRDIVLQITVVEQILDPEDTIEGVKMFSDHLYHLQFLVKLPYTVKNESIPDLARLLLLFNKSSDIPGLEYCEADNTLFWRHVMLCNLPEIDPYILISLIGVILTVTEVYGPYIEAVATGKNSLQEAVQKIREIQSSGAKQQ